MIITKKISAAAVLFALVLNFASTQEENVIFTKKKKDFGNFKAEIAFQEEIFPGDPVYVELTLVPKKRHPLPENSGNCGIKLFSDEKGGGKPVRQSSLYQINRNFVNSKKRVYVGALPTSSFLESGSFFLHVELPSEKDGLPAETAEKIILPLKVLQKEFVSETIYLNAKNTEIRTDTSKKRIAQINRLNEILNSVSEESVWETQGFCFPTDAKRRTSFFADRRIFEYNTGAKSTSLHHGIDWGVGEGNEVRACGRGKVVLAEFRNSTGWSVCVEHLPGLYSLYYHLSGLDVVEGQFIEKGGLIGLSGSTGLATGPHIHWEIRLNGESVNPDWFVGYTQRKIR